MEREDKEILLICFGARISRYLRKVTVVDKTNTQKMFSL